MDVQSWHSGREKVWRQRHEPEERRSRICQKIRIKEPLSSTNWPRTRTGPLPCTTERKTTRPGTSTPGKLWSTRPGLTSSRRKPTRNRKLPPARKNKRIEAAARISQKPEAQVHPEFAASQKEHLELDSALKAADAPSIVKIPARWRN